MGPLNDQCHAPSVDLGSQSTPVCNPAQANRCVAALSVARSRYRTILVHFFDRRDPLGRIAGRWPILRVKGLFAGQRANGNNVPRKVVLASSAFDNERLVPGSDRMIATGTKKSALQRSAFVP
jgi:hypothetical protein